VRIAGYSDSVKRHSFWRSSEKQTWILKNLDHQILLEAFILLISFHTKAFKVVVVGVVQTFHCIFILEAMCPRQVPFDAHSISGLVQKICYGPLPIAAASRESTDYSLNCELKTH